MPIHAILFPLPCKIRFNWMMPHVYFMVYTGIFHIYQVIFDIFIYIFFDVYTFINDRNDHYYNRIFIIGMLPSLYHSGHVRIWESSSYTKRHTGSTQDADEEENGEVGETDHEIWNVRAVMTRIVFHIQQRYFVLLFKPINFP